MLLVLFLFAQVTAGTITGFIRDTSGRPVDGAEIIASSADRGIERRALTDSTGLFRLVDLPPTTYAVTARAVNFHPAVARAVTVEVNARVRLDFELPLAPLRQSVEVQAPQSLLSTESSEVGLVLADSRIRNLPLNRRDFLQLALLAPGVLPPVEDSELSQRGSFAMHVNGAREEFNNFLLDGADNNDPYTNRYLLQPPVDVIQAFKVITGTYSAEYGRSAGAQVNIITRSGTNDWHGDLYEYLRNRTFDARNFFDAGDKPKYQRHQFGAGAGGPLARDRSFVFANFDGLRERRGLSRLATVPSIAERAGDLSGLGRPVIDPFTGSAFPGNVIPSARISPVARRILELFPLPNRAAIPANLLAQPVLRENQWQANARVDQRLTSRDQLTFRYSFGDQDIRDPFAEESTDVPGFGEVVANRGHNAALHHQHVFGPSVINSLRLGFSHAVRSAYPENFGADVGRLWSVDWLNVRTRDFGYPFFNIAGFSAVGDVTQLPLSRTTNHFHISESIAIGRGRHSVRAGVEVARAYLNGFLDFFARGSLSFSGAISGSGISDLLLGLPSFGIQSQFDNPQRLRSTATRLFVQDDWKLRHDLTLNVGLRYEYDTPPVDRLDRMAIFDPATGRLTNVGASGLPRAGIFSDRDNLAPRIGFAWTPAENWVLRGGYGLYYDSGMWVVNSSLYFNPPYFNVRVFFPSRTALLTLANPFPAVSGITPPASVNTLNPRQDKAYLQHWSLNVQRQLGAATIVSAAYVGSKGTHLLRARDLNQPRPAPGPVQARRPLPAFGNIFFIESGANSSYNSLQLSLDRRLARRFFLISAYTWSKSIDDSSAFLGTRADKNFPQDSLNYRAERAVSSYDVPHRFSSAFGYELTPNTSLRGIVTAQSGQPFTPILRFDNSNTGNTGGIFGSDRPNLLGDPHIENRGAERWFDTSAFAVPPQFTFGNAGRNILRGDRLFSFDLALARRFPLSERLAIELDAQAFNLFNTTNFDLPERFADERASFGRVFSAKPPRQIQLALRLAW